MIKPVVNLIKAASSNTKPAEIAHAFALGMLLGLMPKNNLLWYIIFVAFYFMRIQRGVLTLAMLLGTLIAPACDGLFDSIGNFVLTLPFMEKPMQFLLNIPFVSFTKINNSVVMGSLLSGLVLYVPNFYIARLLVWLYRRHIAAWLNKWKVVTVIKQLPLVEKIASIAGGN